MRDTLSGAQDTLDKTLELVDDAQKTVEQGKEILNDVNKLSTDLQATISAS